MTVPYSLDLRLKVVHACQHSGQTRQAVAELFGVSLSFVEGMMRRVRRVRRNADLAPRKWRPGPRVKIDPAGCERLERWLQEQPDLTLLELAKKLQAEGGPAVSTPTLCRVLQRLGLGRKKRLSMPASGTLRKYVRHATNTGKTSPDTP